MERLFEQVTKNIWDWDKVDNKLVVYDLIFCDAFDYNDNIVFKATIEPLEDSYNVKVEVEDTYTLEDYLERVQYIYEYELEYSKETLEFNKLSAQGVINLIADLKRGCYCLINEVENKRIYTWED